MKHLLSILLAFLLPGALLQAADPPYQHTGMVNSVYPDDNRVVINDRSFRIAPYVTVHADSMLVGLHYMPESGPVGFSLELQPGGERMINEVWVLDSLPKDRALED